MATSGYYDEIAKVEALRKQRLWQFRRDSARRQARSAVRRVKQAARRPSVTASKAFRKR